MDSGNSDSFQSSNGGGDEEYNSRGGGDTISAFINQAATQGGLIYNTPTHQSTNQSMFNPTISSYQNLQNNLDMAWSEPQRSDPNCTETINPLSSHQHFTIQNSSLPSSSVQEIMNISSRTSSLPNPKKRSRASRRAPTTVLTTDTTNFRAMVQEFTGIPAPPFTSSSSSSLFSRNSRLDNLFGTSSMRSNNNNPLDYSISLSSQPPSYLRRPFPQKVQPSLASSSSSSMFVASMVDSLRTNVDDSYQRLQSSNLFTMQNPILASLLQSNPSSPPSLFGSKAHHGSGQIQSSNGFQVDDNASLGALPGLVSADPARWGSGVGGANGGGGDQVRSFGNNNNGSGGCDDLTRNVGNGKRQRAMMEDGGIGARSEGMMETWICSSSE